MPRHSQRKHDDGERVGSGRSPDRNAAFGVYADMAILRHSSAQRWLSSAHRFISAASSRSHCTAQASQMSLQMLQTFTWKPEPRNMKSALLAQI
jgi:hypothetical protein